MKSKYKLLNVDTSITLNPDLKNVINDAVITPKKFNETAFGKDVLWNKIKNSNFFNDFFTGFSEGFTAPFVWIRDRFNNTGEIINN